MPNTLPTDPAAALAVLIDAIRASDATLKDLRLIVGPPPIENQRAADRIARLDRLSSAYGPDESTWPPHARETQRRIMADQNAFERAWA